MLALPWAWGPEPRPSLSLFFSRAVSGVDADPDLVHMEVQDLGGGKLAGRGQPEVPECPGPAARLA